MRTMPIICWAVIRELDPLVMPARMAMRTGRGFLRGAAAINSNKDRTVNIAPRRVGAGLVGDDATPFARYDAGDVVGPHNYSTGGAASVGECVRPFASFP